MVDLNQAVVSQEEVSQEEVSQQEVRNPQEVLRVVQVVGQKEEPQRELQEEVTLGDQGEGAILGVSLISQYLQIKI